jgi:hypothetical protein
VADAAWPGAASELEEEDMSKDYQCTESGMCSAECQQFVNIGGDGRAHDGKCGLLGNSKRAGDHCQPWSDDRQASYERRKAERAKGGPELRTRTEYTVALASFPPSVRRRSEEANSERAAQRERYGRMITEKLDDGWLLRGPTAFLACGDDLVMCQALTREVPVEADGPTLDED